MVSMMVGPILIGLISTMLLGDYLQQQEEALAGRSMDDFDLLDFDRCRLENAQSHTYCFPSSFSKAVD